MRTTSSPFRLSPAGRLCLVVLVLHAAAGVLRPQAADNAQAAGKADEISMVVGKAVILDHPDDITRVSISDPAVADAVAVSTREVLLNAKAPGITTLVLWSKSGDRNLFTLNVSPNVQQVEQQLKSMFPGEDIRVLVSPGTVSLIGKVSAPDIAEKAAAVVAPVAKTVVNHLSVAAPLAEKQIILKVRFAEVQRTSLQQFGVNLLSTGALNTPGAVTTQQFSPPRAPDIQGRIGAPVTGYSSNFSLSDALNIFAFRPDLNLGALIRALQANNMIEILAEPNLVATSGKEAIFLVGGEFPVPVVQGGGNAGAVTIQFREFGIRLNFLPVITPRETIKLHVRPEVSSLDYANGVSLAGFLIPALSTRRVETDVELAAGQSFVIAGLLDQRVTENLSRIPGLASIPLLGNLFKSRQVNKNNSELLVLVTPEFPSAIAAGEPRPELQFPTEFLPPVNKEKKK